MAVMGIRKDEGIGLIVAVALHVAVLVALLVSPRKHDVVTPPQRIEVTISDEASLTSTAPNAGQVSPDKGPEQGEPAPEAAPVPEVAPLSPAPVQPAPKPQPAPRVIEKPAPQPRAEPEPKPKAKPVVKPEPKQPPKPVSKALPKPVEREPAPKPAPKAPPKPAAKPTAKQASKPAEKAPPRRESAIDGIVSRPDSKPAKSAAKSAPPGRTATSGKATTPPRKAGSSSFDDAFKQGTPDAKAPAKTGTPAAAVGPEVRSALSSAITRQLKPNWKAPQGPDAEELVTYLAFALNRDGTLAGKPTVVRQSGITDVNRNQAALHAENAIRAVQLAAPFNLPGEYYDSWKRVSSFKFDRRLSQ